MKSNLSPIAKKDLTVLLPSDATPEALESFELEVRDDLRSAPTTLRLECRDLERVDSSHIKAIWNAHVLCRGAGVSAQIANPTAALMRTLNTLDLIDAFEYEGGKIDAGLLTVKDLGLVGLPREYSAIVSADPESINTAIDEFIGFLRSVQAGATSIMELRTVFYEIATNIRLHSGIAAADRFEVQIDADWDRCRLTFVDLGKPFDPTSRVGSIDAAVASTRQQRRGFGIAMISMLAQSVEYRRSENRNQFTVIKNWRR